ncbi:putative quinol monooxygenase [Parvibaculum sp.]|uniref:putative quinol monooxygenase n=1 Tax=Parvibaculum sp. TaxID=2024848 RepID=UPI001B1F7E89|nr:putative quinol monooxygenase [Parvibaculum sp.]MBO6635790.1 antibiotic biosynthesis monooxygenase [Parvibaculum sp.]MBO6678050.1 antibiotic biosynthesis monooxygenase [Parvibaculum sp.]MBO6684372.1 antibiotic biosynthesis monooxygenase [Parvibaculum sp.]MBO6906571.1 antibiotic biosynthesis monooxygenase [Parvibaculum sp.]
MIVVTGLIEVEEESREDAAKLAAGMAQETRKEEGCLAYGFYADIEAPNCFRIYEEWQDMAALERHFATPHMAEFAKGLGAIKLLSMDVKKFEGGPKSPVRG